MKFALIRISTTIKKKKKKKKIKKIHKNKTKNTYIINNRDFTVFTAYKMLFWISTVFNLKTIFLIYRAIDYNWLGKLRKQPDLGM